MTKNIAEFHLIGNVKAYDSLDPYVIFSGLTPLTTDFPSPEGFAAVMLASLTRSDDHVRDLMAGRPVAIPVAPFFRSRTTRSPSVHSTRRP